MSTSRSGTRAKAHDYIADAEYGTEIDEKSRLCSRQEAKNRISEKIKNVGAISKVLRKMQNNPGRSKLAGENSNRQPKVGRSAGNSKLPRNN